MLAPNVKRRETMQNLSRWPKLLGLTLIVLLATGCGTSPRHDSNNAMISLTGQNQPVDYLNKKLIEVFGPLPAIASTPFLSLAILTGTAILMEEPVFADSELRLVQQIRQNALILQAKHYASWWMFGTLTLLAGLTWLANSGKLRGTLGKFVRIAEDVAVGLIYLMIGADALTPNGLTASSPEWHPTRALATMFPDFESSTAILILAALISLTTLMLIRLALDILIWLSPIPFIDLIFETCKVIFSLAFLAIYFLLSPLAAAMLGLLLIVPCFMLLPWAIRLLHFGYRIVLCPMLARWSPAFVPQLIEPALAQSAGGAGVTLACPAWVLKARGFKKRETVVLASLSSGQRTIRPIRSTRRARTLYGMKELVLLGRALAWIELRVVNEEGQLLDRYALPLSMLKDFDQLLLLLGATDSGEFGAMKALRTMVKLPESVSS